MTDNSKIINLPNKADTIKDSRLEAIQLSPKAIVQWHKDYISRIKKTSRNINCKDCVDEKSGCSKYHSCNLIIDNLPDTSQLSDENINNLIFIRDGYPLDKLDDLELSSYEEQIYLCAFTQFIIDNINIPYKTKDKMLLKSYVDAVNKCCSDDDNARVLTICLRILGSKLIENDKNLIDIIKRFDANIFNMLLKWV